MKTLAMETSGRRGSVAVWDSANPAPPSEISLPQGAQTAESLIVIIDQVISKCGWSTGELDLICVTQGPGSFTGLRIGCVTAKVLAFAVDAKIVGVNTLDVLAENSSAGQPLWCVIDAGRGQCFVACYSIDASGHRQVSVEPQLMATETWLSRLTPNDRVTGPLLSTLGELLPAGVEPLSSESWMPRAEFVARIGARNFEHGHTANLWDFSPNYFRLSAAEEKKNRAKQS